MSLELLILVTAMFLLLQAFFAGSEIALVSCDKIKMRSLADQGSKSARLVLKCYQEVERFISTTLVGINLSLIINTILMTFFMQDRYGHRGELYTILILSPLIVVFGQVVPKAIFQRRGNTLVLLTIYPLWIASKIFSPILFLINIFLRGLMRLIGDTENRFITREELLYAIEGNETELQKGYREKVIRRIFRFSETTIEEIMIPLIQVTALNEDSPVKEAVRVIKETGHSRIPIYHERIDNINGMLYAFDILGAKPEDPVKNFSHPPFYVPETKAVDQLLDEMKKGRAGMAVVVDEYGGAVGVVTLENILEEVVGDIEDEYDKGTKLWRKISEDEYLINPKVYIDDINDELGLRLPEGDYDTLSGFLLSKKGSIPRVEDRITYRNYTFIVTKATPRSIEEVKLVIKS
ncbi:MAG TPA: hemolysin family protein [Thermodesulfobacteriota bacterium]|nr:hemolysin family protein [Thermodesulfobacteriota bacterium]